MPSPQARNILAEIEAVWAELDREVTAWRERGLDGSTAAGWSAKEMLGHLAFWAEAVEGFVVSVWRQQPLPGGWAFGSGYIPGDGPWPPFQEHNAREAAWAGGQADEAVVARLAAAHERLVAFIGTVTGEEADRDPQYWRDVAGHLGEHLQELRAT